jgi:hypothetical protein
MSDSALALKLFKEEQEAVEKQKSTIQVLCFALFVMTIFENLSL